MKRPIHRIGWTSVLILAAGLGVFVGTLSQPHMQKHSGLNVSLLPVCQDNEFLVYRAGGLVCEALKAALPTCGEKFVTSKKEGENVTLACSQ